MIQTFRPVYDVEACLSEIRECLERGWTGTGFKTVEFEEKWKEYTGLPNAHFLCNATAGLNMAVRILKEQNGWEDDAEIISTPITFVATNNAVLVNHLKIVFADVDNTLCMDPDDVERRITAKTKAVIFVGLGGSVGHYEEIAALCKKHDLKLILDAAHMAGTRYKGEIPGKDADAVVYSYHVTKPLSTADSGMLCFKEKQYDELARKLSWNGMDKSSSPAKYDRHYKWKMNVPCVVDAYNGNSIMAAIALAQLPHLDEENAYRRQLAAWYKEELHGCEKITLVEEPEECESARWLFQVLVEDRDALMEYMEEHGVSCALHYLDNTEYPMYAHLHGTCPRAAYVSEHAISLPMHLDLEKSDIEYICRTLKKYYEEGKYS